jgi:hypothetical protein
MAALAACPALSSRTTFAAKAPVRSLRAQRLVARASLSKAEAQVRRPVRAWATLGGGSRWKAPGPPAEASRRSPGCRMW